MNKVAKVTWVSIAVLLTIVLIAFLATRGGN
jgi:cytochrome oxidase assembly protein ShyY1